MKDDGRVFLRFNLPFSFIILFICPDCNEIGLLRRDAIYVIDDMHINEDVEFKKYNYLCPSCRKVIKKGNMKNKLKGLKNG